MSWQVLIMYAVAAVLGAGGAGLLLLLTRPQGPAAVYVYRMAGIMLVAGGVLLGFMAHAMQGWGVAR